MQSQKILTCNLCGSPNSKVLWVENGINVVECNNCGFAYSQTPPARAFERKEKAEDIFKKTERKKRVYDQILHLLKVKRGGSLLDVGCRTGNFLLAGKSEGFLSVTGIEISAKFATFTSGLGFKVLNCRLEEAVLPDQSFDVITYLETLEHISTPLDELTEAYRILKPGGIIVAEVPNLTFQLFKAKVSRFFHIGHFGLKSHDHLVQFTDRTIRETLTKAGFKNIITRLRAHYIEAGSPMFFKAFSFLFNYFSRLIRWVFGLTIGNAIIATAQKNTDK